MVNPIIKRILGNFGVSFFSPLVGGNVAETIYDFGATFEQYVIISAVAAVFTTGLAISKEVAENAERKRK